MTTATESGVSAWQVLVGDARDVLTGLPAASAHACVTSPPYYGLRDYGHDSQIGLEATPEDYVAQLVSVFAEVRRVLRDDGTLWLNLGDSYAPSGAIPPGATYKPKDLIGIPWLVAFALRADGWYLRQEIIWHKRSVMPESVRDRCTRAHEQVFMFSKRARYFYDAEALREPDVSGHGSGNGFKRPGRRSYAGKDGSPRGQDTPWEPGGGRNRRSVWTLAPTPFPDAHFAVMPAALAADMVRASTPEKACAACGAPWERVVERSRVLDGERAVHGAWARSDDPIRMPANGIGHWRTTTHVKDLGLAPACACDSATTAGVVLDPFAGAGTTGLAAIRHRRAFVGIELNPEYASMARRRIETDARLGHRPPRRPPGETAARLFDPDEEAA